MLCQNSFTLLWCFCRVICGRFCATLLPADHARRSGRISGADLDPVPCQGHSAACLQSSVMNALLWWGLRHQCFIWDLASHFEQELVPQPLLSYLPPTPTVVLLRLNAFPNSWLLARGGITLLVKNHCWCCRVCSCSLLVVQMLAWTGTEVLFRDCF